MKFLISFLLAASTTLSGFSQIKIAEYPKKISCQVDYTQELEAPEATSSCGKVAVTYTEDVFSGGCLGTLVRNYEYTDPCGNKATADQYISLTDNLAPELFGVPEDITWYENGIPPIVQVSARDNSGTLIEVVFSEKREGAVLTRTWSGTDPCGNATTEIQQIRLK